MELQTLPFGLMVCKVSSREDIDFSILVKETQFADAGCKIGHGGRTK